MRNILLTLVVLTTVPAVAGAQSGANATIQLPSYSTFGANTTVVVPDRGASAVAFWGPFPQRRNACVKAFASRGCSD